MGGSLKALQQDIQIIIIVAIGLVGLALFIWLATKCIRWRNANLKETVAITEAQSKLVMDHNRGIASATDSHPQSGGAYMMYRGIQHM